MMTTIRETVLGKPLDPLKAETRQSLALVAFLAWVGLGADGLSSSAYGPEQAFRALGANVHLGLWLALATAATVFVIALAYNQVIELFPNGGGGYRVATVLLGERAGLLSGAALVVDYVLTIAISVAGGVDALFSMLPVGAQTWKLAASLAAVVALVWANLRGMKESIRMLLPIFLIFVLTHTVLIMGGVLLQGAHLPPQQNMAGASWLVSLGVLLKAYSLGGGTYTGIEAVSNNVGALAEPRVRTGRVTMLYMACSLAFTAGGILLIYLLWNVRPQTGQTLNAVAFHAVLAHAGLSGGVLASVLGLVLASEAGLLLVAANTGFLGGPAVLANMAADSWVPHQFRYLSTRLVTQNGVLLMGAAALVVLACSGAAVDWLVVLYSINVFLTFSLSLAGLCRHWWQRRGQARAHRRLALSGLGLAVTGSILCVTVVEKFFEGGWITLAITALVVILCLGVRRHYAMTRERVAAVDRLFASQPFGQSGALPEPDPLAPTAVFLVGGSRGGGLHALLWVQRMFPERFRQVLFLSVRTVDAQAYGATGEIDRLRTEAQTTLQYFVDFCRSHGMAAQSRFAFGTDPVETLERLCMETSAEHPHAIFFTSALVFARETLFTRLLHNEAALTLQRRLHFAGQQLVILPMKV